MKATINRPRTAHGTTGRQSPSTSLRDTDFRAFGANRTGVPTIASPGTSLTSHPTLHTARSEAHLHLGLGARNLSSTSLAMPPKTRDFASDIGPRPGTSGSMRGCGDRASPSLHLDFSNVSTPAFGVSYRSPLSHFEGLESPVKSDSESLLGDEPDKIADEIEARIAREEEEKAMAKAADQERRREQALMEVRRRRAEAQMAACPSPPASIASEHDVPTLLVPGPKPSPRSPASLQDVRPVSRGSESNRKPTGQPGPRAQTSSADDERSSLRARLPSTEGPLSSLKASALDALTNGGLKPGFERSKTEPPPGTQLLSPQSSREPTRSATMPAPSKAPRSPLFQQMGPFDVHSEEEDDEDEPKVDHRAGNAPYGLPSPPLSHRTRPSDEEKESRPIVRTVVARRNTVLVDGPGDDEDEGRPTLETVKAKRDTILVGRPGHASLDLEIELFEKSLQQAQAMSALESQPSPGIDLRIRTRSRTNSNGSSNYSDMSESPMTIEPPLVSPKPFPLSPRPMSPGGKLRASGASTVDIAPQEPPTLEVGEGSAFGSVMQRPAGIKTRRTGPSEDRNDNADGKPVRPRVGAAAPPHSTLGDHDVKVNKIPSLAGRVRRPSPDEYQVRQTRTPLSAATSPFHGDAPFDTESPILKHVLPTLNFDQLSDTFSEGSSRANSPVSSLTGSGSYSVFSPPPPPTVKRPVAPPLRSVKPEWNFGPAPTAPPTSPLPIPDRIVAHRKNTLELATQRTHERSVPKNPKTSAPVPGSPGLASSASIVPDTGANPHWPLPSPKKTSSLFSSPPAQSSEGGFTARRSLFRDKRSPPAPLNIAATRYADESMIGGGPWTPDVVVSAAGGKSLAPPVERPKTAGQRETMIITPAADAGFDFLKGSPAVNSVSEAGNAPDGSHLGEEDKSAAIGVARGLSIRYDRMRGDGARRERGGAKKTQMMSASPAWRLDEEEETTATTATTTLAPVPRSGLSSGTASPALLREPLDRTLRPNRGLKSPTGIADEQGVRFI